jgi:mRNA-degrading endonuclease toxin of MazEF toxin-antitoxin module
MLAVRCPKRRGEVVLVDSVHSGLTVGRQRPAIVVQADYLNALIANTVLIRVTKTVRHGAAEVASAGGWAATRPH